MNQRQALNHVAFLLAWNDWKNQDAKHLCPESVEQCRERNDTVADLLDIKTSYYTFRSLLDLS